MKRRFDKLYVGGSDFNAEIARIRDAANEITDALSRILEGTPGPQTIYALIAKCAVKVGIILDAVANIDKIGKNEKKERTKKEGPDRDPIHPAPTS